ncbi:MAG: DUF494 domain-containing protein [Candidatus Kapabacteria bacterium]|nr:DUF494 domain-containing protein [Candidatus Kapabacteria bacterium]
MINRYAVQRIMQIIAHLMAERQAGAKIAQIDTNELHQLGYSDSEIAAALSWILERSDSAAAGRRASGATPGSFRVLHDIEHDLITPEAWGLLLSLHDVGFLAIPDVEQILERAVVMGSERGVDVDEISSIIAVYLLTETETMMPGGRMYLDGNDTIQ